MVDIEPLRFHQRVFLLQIRVMQLFEASKHDFAALHAFFERNFQQVVLFVTLYLEQYSRKRKRISHEYNV